MPISMIRQELCSRSVDSANSSWTDTSECNWHHDYILLSPVGQ